MKCCFCCFNCVVENDDSNVCDQTREAQTGPDSANMISEENRIIKKTDF